MATYEQSYTHINPMMLAATSALADTETHSPSQADVDYAPFPSQAVHSLTAAQTHTWQSDATFAPPAIPQGDWDPSNTQRK